MLNTVKGLLASYGYSVVRSFMIAGSWADSPSSDGRFVDSSIYHKRFFNPAFFAIVSYNDIEEKAHIEGNFI